MPSLPRAVKGGGTFLPVGLHAGGTQAVPNVTSTTQRKHGQVAVGLGKDRAGHSRGSTGRGRKSAHPCPHQGVGFLKMGPLGGQGAALLRVSLRSLL